MTHRAIIGHRLVIVCVFCLLCLSHLQCFQTDSINPETRRSNSFPSSDPKLLHSKDYSEFCDNLKQGTIKCDYKNVEEVKLKRLRRNSVKGEEVDLKEAYFIKKVFDKFGDGETMTLDGFVQLFKSLGLDRLVPERHSGINERISVASAAVSNVAGGKSSNVSSVDARISDTVFEPPSHLNNRSTKCLNGRELFSELSTPLHRNDKDGSASAAISHSSLAALCPGILYQLTAVSDTDRAGGCMVMSQLDDILIKEVEEINQFLVWTYSSLSILIVSLCGLLGVAVIPVMQKVFYHQLLQFLVALAVGTLCGDALLHLLPHAMLASSGSHHHGHSHSLESETDHDDNMWKGFVAALGILFFFVMEKCLTLVSEWRKKTQRMRKLPPVKVMRDADNMGSSSVGEKLCKHKYSSYPYCYGEIKNATDGVDNDKKNHLHLLQQSKDEKFSLPEELAETDCSSHCCEGKLHSDHGDYGNDVAHSEAESYMVIIREHENKHHGHSHAHGHVHSAPENMSSVAWMVIMGDGLHNFTDGMAIGAAFAGSIAGGFSTAVAVFCHELPHELGDFAVLLKAGMSAKQAVFYNLLSSILCFFGMVLGIFLGNTEKSSSWVFAAAAGMFIYIALVDMIPELTTSHAKEGGSMCQCILQFIGLLSGIGIMLLIAMYEHDLKTVFTDAE